MKGELAMAARRHIALALLALALSCVKAETVGVMQGISKEGNISTGFEIKFPRLEIEFPSDGSATLTLSNLSSDKLTLVLVAKNAQGGSADSRWPSGTYSLSDQSLASASAEVRTSGANPISLTASSGYLNFDGFGMNGDEIGSAAGNFDLRDGDSVHYWGNFSETY
jgi:hypothetical protein